MRAARRIVCISDHDHFADYAELGVLRDQERFARTAPRPVQWGKILGPIGGFLVSIALWYGFIWAAVGGWRIVHHYIDQLCAALALR